MNYQPYLKPGVAVDVVPAPREKVPHLMIATALVVEGLINDRPGRTDARLTNSLYMSQASLIILGTACQRPLMLREAADVSLASELDVLVVRSGDRPRDTSFDLKRAGGGDVLCAYRMWMGRPSAAAWLIPTAGEGPYVRVTPLGLQTEDAAPFDNDFDRRAGLARGRDFLSIPGQGWF